jgi:glycosyltransferase involved in cell wall biosynthesis
VRPLIVDLGRDYRGGQHQALLLAQGLLERGHAPQLLTPRDSLLAARAHDFGIVVHGVAEKSRRLAATFAIRKLVGARAIDIVHANEPHALTAAWLARAHRTIPVVVSRRVIYPLSRSAMSQARYRSGACIIAVSQYVADATGLPRERLAVIPDGVPRVPSVTQTERETARRTFGIPQDVPLVGCVAVLAPDKGQSILIRALKTVREEFPHTELLLVGEGPCRKELTALVESLGLASAIHFAGFLKDLNQAYAAMDVFAFPAQAEGLGSALLMAMAIGLPVVAMARGGIPEIIESEKNGLLISEPEPARMADAIRQLLSNPERASRLSENARETIAQRYSMEHMVDATLHLYEQLMAAR